MIAAGFHVPVTPSTEVVGNIGAVVFMQIEFGTTGKAGTRLLTIVMFREIGPAHCPAAGVNVYAVVPRAIVLIVAGLHVPVIPSFEVVGSTGATAFKQTEFGTDGNVGITLLAIVTFNETEPAH